VVSSCLAFAGTPLETRGGGVPPPQVVSFLEPPEPKATGSNPVGRTNILDFPNKRHAHNPSGSVRTRRTASAFAWVAAWATQERVAVSFSIPFTSTKQ